MNKTLTETKILGIVRNASICTKGEDPKISITEATQSLITLFYQEMEVAKKKGARERIICAAIQDSNNRIFRGHRHHDAIHAMSTRPGKGQVVKEGFMTSHNRFVERKEAMEIQIKAGLQPESERGIDLFSEDLY